MTGRFLSKGAPIGYRSAAWGAITQLTSRTTGVTLHKMSGAITLFTAVGSATFASFTVTNSLVEIGDVIVPVQRGGTDLYHFNITAVANGSFRVSFATTGGTTSEAITMDYVVIKGQAK